MSVIKFLSHYADFTMTQIKKIMKNSGLNLVIYHFQAKTVSLYGTKVRKHE